MDGAGAGSGSGCERLGEVVRAGGFCENAREQGRRNFGGNSGWRRFYAFEGATFAIVVVVPEAALKFPRMACPKFGGSGEGKR